ncbi:hypothetical protein [Pseudomonas syringae]|uniref:hypothetical protein n=1 Tax=Pseudomonas syringae TaxID=317 RepID=UPI0009B5300B|nr:hypothetical protein [Pseudomonas syringae]
MLVTAHLNQVDTFALSVAIRKVDERTVTSNLLHSPVNSQPANIAKRNIQRRYVLNSMISSSLIERCAILFDALIKEGENEGYSWKINAEGKTIVTVNDEHLIHQRHSLD